MYSEEPGWIYTEDSSGRSWPLKLWKEWTEFHRVLQLTLPPSLCVCVFVWIGYYCIVLANLELTIGWPKPIELYLFVF